MMAASGSFVSSYFKLSDSLMISWDEDPNFFNMILLLVALRVSFFSKAGDLDSCLSKTTTYFGFGFSISFMADWKGSLLIQRVV